ncbi:MAG: sugar kinase [Candidatus Gastranaerophilales bacterium]|nr:sugar kinase [Candidatus Gastranaerophilales bacterium]
MDNKLDLITIGEGLVELSSRQSLTYAETLNKYFGGDTLTTAIAAARSGAKVGFISKIGNDAFRDFLIGGWAAEGLDISRVTCVDGHNGVYFVAGHDTGHKEFAYYRKKTAAGMLSVRDIDEEYVKSAKVVYATGITQSLSLSAKEAVAKLFKIAKENNILVAFDPNFDPKLWTKEEAREAYYEVDDYIDIIFLNLKSDSLELWGIESPDKLIEMALDKGIKTVVLKSKARGGYFVGTANKNMFIPFYSDIKNDSTGAGDSFNGVFLYELSKDKSPFEAAKIASVVSGLQVRNIGAIKAIPSAKEVADAIKEQNEKQ